MSQIYSQLESIAAVFGSVPGLSASVELPAEVSPGSPQVAPVIFVDSYSIEVDDDYIDRVRCVVNANWRIRIGTDIGADRKDEMTIIESCLTAIPAGMCSVNITATDTQQRAVGSNYMEPTITTVSFIFLERTQ